MGCMEKFYFFRWWSFYLIITIKLYICVFSAFVLVYNKMAKHFTKYLCACILLVRYELPYKIGT